MKVTHLSVEGGEGIQNVQVSLEFKTQEEVMKFLEQSIIAPLREQLNRQETPREE